MVSMHQLNYCSFSSLLFTENNVTIKNLSWDVSNNNIVSSSFKKTFIVNSVMNIEALVNVSHFIALELEPCAVCHYQNENKIDGIM